MSLVNDMLRDLEARRAAEIGAVSLQREVRALPTQSPSRRPWALLAVLLLVLAGLGWSTRERIAPLAALSDSVAPAVTPSVAPAAPTPLATTPPGLPDLRATPPVAEADSVPVLAAAPPPADDGLRLAPALTNPPVAAPQGATPGTQGSPQAPVPPAPAPAAGAAPGAVAAATTVPSPAVGPTSVQPPVQAQAPVQAKAPVLPAAAVQTDGPAPGAGTAPVAPVPPKAAAAPSSGAVHIEKTAVLASPRERAEAEYRRAQALLSAGQTPAAADSLVAALHHDPAHGPSRQALLRLFLEAQRFDEAAALLQQGLDITPAQTGWAMSLARLQVERGDLAAAEKTLARSAAHARAQADYAGFHGHLLLRLGQAGAAVERYDTATRLAAAEGRWWFGLGQALEATGRGAEARDAYRRALASGSLNADLMALAESRLK